MTARPHAALLFALMGLAACSRPPSGGGAEAAVAPAVVARGVVETTGGLVQVLAPRDAVVSAIAVQEGDRVAAGQLLARLDDRQARLQLDAATADAAERRSEADVAAVKAQGARREAARLDRLATADAAPRQEADTAQASAAVASGEAQQARAAIDAAAARQRLAAFEVGVRTVSAPAAGLVVRRTAATGSYVATASPMFVIEPEGARQVRAELDEASADRVRPGMAATVTPEFQSGGGVRARVLRVADVLSGLALADEAQARPDARAVTATLVLPPGAAFRVGQRVLVRFTP